MSEENKKIFELDCDIVRDLLPLYCDNSVSEASCEAIEKHLDRCEKCKDEYETMSLEITDNKASTKNSGAAKTLKKAKSKGFLKGFIISFFAVAILIGAGYILTQEPLIPIPEDEYKICGVYKFDNKIAVDADISCECAMYGRIFTTDEKGEILNIVYKRPVINIYGKNNRNNFPREIIIIDLTKDKYKNAKQIKFNGKKIFNEGENGDTPIPGYLPIYAEAECCNDGSIVGYSVSNNEISHEYRDGTVKVWDINGNYLRSYLMQN